MAELTQKYILSLFTYRGSNLFWKVKKAPWIKIGDLAGYISGNRRIIHIDGKNYFAHRLIFLYNNGYLPKFLDHIDGNSLNNDVSNLREATLSQNQGNRKKNKIYNGKLPSSEFKGVYRNKRREKWASQIVIDGKAKYLGYYDSEIKAAEVYNTAATKYFGDYACLNIIPQPL